MQRIENYAKLFFWILSIMLFPLVGLMFYTKEYGGDGNKVGPIKELFDKVVPLSFLMIIIIFLFILIAIFGVLIFILRLAKKENSKELEEAINKSKSEMRIDRTTLEKIKDILTVEYMMNFFMRKDFELESFSIDDIDIMDDFIGNKNNPHLKFIDCKLEETRLLMINNMSELSNLLRNNNEQLGLSNAWRIPRRSKVSISKLANKYSLEVWKSYEHLIISGRDKLEDN